MRIEPNPEDRKRIIIKLMSMKSNFHLESEETFRIRDRICNTLGGKPSEEIILLMETEAQSFQRSSLICEEISKYFQKILDELREPYDKNRFSRLSIQLSYEICVSKDTLNELSIKCNKLDVDCFNRGSYELDLLIILEESLKRAVQMATNVNHLFKTLEEQIRSMQQLYGLPPSLDVLRGTFQ